MDRESVVELSRLLREWIERIERVTDGLSRESDRSLRRVLALLWSACDELAIFERNELVDTP